MSRKYDEEVLAHIRLGLTEHVGPITFRHLMARFGSASRALEALPDLSRRGGRRAPLKPYPKDRAEKEIERANAFGARLLLLGHADYPPLLAHIEDAPPLLFYRGAGHLLKAPAAAIVGARNASASGLRLAAMFARDIGAAGYVVVSGLARGIDTAAHRASLATGTVAVIAGGLDDYYPRENEALQKQLFEAGGVLTEATFGTQPLARHFPRRNRIIAGLSLGAVVIEAARKSGSLITARLAADYGRTVFAVPGSPLDPRSLGGNDLILDGAVLTQSPGDIIAELDRQARKPVAEPQGELFEQAFPETAPCSDPGEAARARILALLSYAPVEIDDIIRLSELTPSAVLTILLEFELAGAAQRQPGNRAMLCPVPE